MRAVFCQKLGLKASEFYPFNSRSSGNLYSGRDLSVGGFFQFIRQAKVFFVDGVLIFDTLESGQYLGLLPGREDLICHREEDVILFQDVLAQQGRIPERVLNDLLFGGRVAGFCAGPRPGPGPGLAAGLPRRDRRHLDP